MTKTKKFKWKVGPIKVNRQQFAKEHFTTRLIDYFTESLVKRASKTMQTKPEVHSVPETARILKTDVSNVYSLIRLGLIKPLLLGDQMVPNDEIKRFIADNLGKDLRQTIADEKEQQKQSKLSEQRAKVVNMR